VKKNKIKVSLIIGSYMRADLLTLSLWSIARQTIDYPFEVIVLNDGIEDDTEKVCDEYKDKLNIKYIFTGQRNKENKFYRNSGFAMNIGVKQSTGDIVILSGAEIFHLNKGINSIIYSLLENDRYLSVPRKIYFDDNGNTSKYLLKQYSSKKLEIPLPLKYLREILKNREIIQATKMPFLMGMYKKRFVEIGGYDEDFIGYAGDDNDFVQRLIKNNCEYCRNNAKVVHLYHGKRCDSDFHWNNPAWVYNFFLFHTRKNKIIRNKNREWGEI